MSVTRVTVCYLCIVLVPESVKVKMAT